MVCTAAATKADCCYKVAGKTPIVVCSGVPDYWMLRLFVPHSSMVIVHTAAAVAAAAVLAAWTPHDVVEFTAPRPLIVVSHCSLLQSLSSVAQAAGATQLTTVIMHVAVASAAAVAVATATAVAAVLAAWMWRSVLLPGPRCCCCRNARDLGKRSFTDQSWCVRYLHKHHKGG